MRNARVRITWVLAVLIVGVLAGFGREQTPAVRPVVVANSPANGATGVAVTTSITVTFDEPVNPTTANSSTFGVTGHAGTPVLGTITYSGSTATFTPNSPLAASSTYTATITTGVQDPAGIALAANFVWTSRPGRYPRWCPPIL